MKIPSIGNTFEDLEYPEWEQQENEKPKHKHMFDLFCAHGGSIRHWARDMKNTQKGTIFHGVKVKYDPFGEENLRKLATAHFYHPRRDAKDTYDIDYDNKKMDEIERTSKLDNFKQADDNESEILDTLKTLKGELNGTQTKDFVLALNGLRDYKNELRGKSKETKVKVDANVESTAEVKTDFQRDVDDFQKKIISGNLSDRVSQKLDNTLNGD